MMERAHRYARGVDGTAGAGVSRLSRRRAGTGHATGATLSHDTAPHRRYPPYARQTAHYARADARVLVGAYGWDTARALAASGIDRPTAVMPDDGTDPDGYDWTGIAAGRDVCILYVADDADLAHRTAVAVVRTGAALAVTVEITGDPACPMRSYRPREVRHAA